MSVSLEDVLAQLNPKLRKNILVGDEVPKTEYAKTPSFGLNRALNGGLPYGRQVLVWGSKSSAKSSLCLQIIAEAQKEGKICAWIDAEMSYDKDWAEKLGVDVTKLIVSQARTINEMVDVGVQLMEAGVDVIVVDSITSLLPAIYFEKDSNELKALENTKQIGAESRDFSNAWKMINYANNKIKPTLFILISQSRNNINSMYTSQQPTGGQATKFYSSTVIKLFSSESDNQALKGKIHVGDKVIEEKIGRKVRWELQFSKTSPAFQSGEYDFYFRGDNLGVDSVGDLVDTAELMGIVERTGAWYLLPDGSKVQGREGFVNKVREDLDLQNMIKAKISG
ncbi:MAG: ATPase domain-containing protein [bacterium]|jgi:recombination protein RecA